MAGKHGVEAVKSAITVAKLAAIAILQNIKKDGFQPTDLFSPLASPTFNAELEKAKDKIQNVLPELAELDLQDGFELARFAYSVFADVKTEITPALEAMRKLEKSASMKADTKSAEAKA